MFKYMSAEVAPMFAKTLKVRFTQPFELNDPLLSFDLCSTLLEPPMMYMMWSKLGSIKCTALFGEYVTLTMGSDLQIPLRISGTSASMLQDSAGIHWPRKHDEE